MTSNGVKKITRNRDTLTCAPCRARKLKCDKQLPACGSCEKRGEQSSCSYSKALVRKDVVEHTRVSRAEARLQHLEQLVQDFVQTSGTGSPGSVPNHDSDTLVNGGYPVYTGATHYSAMLEDIDDLKQILGDELESNAASPVTNEAIAAESDVLFGGTPRLNVQAILSRHLPPRIEVDRRVAAYLRAEAIAAPFVHIPQFYRQYEEFWKSPAAAAPLWISMLFSVCHLSQHVGSRAYVSGATEHSANGYDPASEPNFSLAAAHCLALGRYTRPQRYTVEALGIYLQARVISTLDPSRDLGVLFGTLIQIAYCMGYHRDPTRIKGLTPFEGEMRRRAWSYCMQLDMLVSFQMGLPNNVQFGTWDTRIPSNYHDNDIDEDDVVLPPPRPDTQATKITFYSAKHKLMTIFDKILKHALSVEPARSEDELVALDAELHSTYEAVPDIFRYKTLSEQIVDPAYLVMTRKCVELMYTKCLCVLHRKHVAFGRRDSIRKCLTGSTRTVRAFFELYTELGPGGQFNNQRWLLGSVTWNDFLLGVMVLCLVLCRSMRSDPTDDPELEPQERSEIGRLLETAHHICLENYGKSLGARRTARLLESLLPQVAGMEAQQLNAKTLPHKAMIPDDMSGQSAEQIAVPTNGNYEENNTISWAGWNDPWTNVFDTQEWTFLEECLNTNFNTE